jgi:capsule polysaccharide export protein KpsE/RkpR
LRKELAKIKIRYIEKDSKAYLQHKPEAANEPFRLDNILLSFHVFSLIGSIVILKLHVD